MNTSKQPIFTIKLRPEPSVLDPIKALRALLKTALRRFGLRCISAYEDKDNAQRNNQ